MTKRSRSRLAAWLALAGLLTSTSSLWAQEEAPLAVPSLVGDSGRDLVFTPVPRCRVIDTRVEGGRLTAGLPRAFDVAGPLAGQGGAADCQVPYGPATVVVLNVMAVQPLGAGTLAAWPFGGTMPTATLVGYNARPLRGAIGANANEVTLPLCDPTISACTYDLNIQANGSDTHLVADVAGFFSKVTGVTVPWTSVTDMPPDFADGTDDNTQYSAGLGLTQVGTVFSVNTSVIQNRVTQTCAAGSSIRAIDSAGGVTCETDTDTTYAAGNGISVSGGTISVANLGVGSAMLAAGAVTAGKIAPKAVTYAEIADRTVNTGHIAVGAITGTELSSYAVVANKIASGVVGAAEIATDGVGAAEIAAGAVGAEEIATGAVGRSKIDGAEVKIYKGLSACGADDVVTFRATCTTNLCTPVPVPLFWDCNHNCDSFVPLVCNNTLMGYLLSPNIE